MENVIQLEKINKSFLEQHVLKDVSLEVKKGEMVAITGTSGSGKSTLLNIIGLFLSPDKGEYYLNGKLIQSLSEKEKAGLRNSCLGFVVQDFALIEQYTVLQNIWIPVYYTKEKVHKKTIEEKVDLLLKQFDIYQKKNEKICNLSGGQKQRVALIRALINDPEIILADEPTGALDNENTENMMNLLKELNKQGKTIVIVTHDSEVASKCDRIVTISDGVIENQIVEKPR